MLDHSSRLFRLERHTAKPGHLHVSLRTPQLGTIRPSSFRKNPLDTNLLTRASLELMIELELFPQKINSTKTLDRFYWRVTLQDG